MFRFKHLLTFVFRDPVQLETPTRTLSARLLVGADGGNSFVRKMAGIENFGWNYNQKGVVATVKTNEPSHTAYQRFLSTGPVALLPVLSAFMNLDLHFSVTR